MSDENQLPRQFILLEQVMAVIAAVIPADYLYHQDDVPSQDGVFYRQVKVGLSSFSSDPFSSESRKSFQKGMEVLDVWHDLARECTRNCFLTLDLAKYESTTKLALSSLISAYREALPKELAAYKKMLGTILESNSHESSTDYASLMSTLNDCNSLYLRWNLDDKPIEISIPNTSDGKLVVSVIGCLGGFGLVANFLPEKESAFVEEAFGGIGEVGANNFIQTVRYIIEHCPKDKVELLAEQLCIGEGMEKRLTSTMQRHTQQLYLFGQYSEKAHNAVSDLCDSVGIKMPQSLEEPIIHPLTQRIALNALAMQQQKLLNTDISDLCAYDPNNPIAKAVLAYQETAPTEVTGAGANKSNLPATKPATVKCPFGYGSGS